MHQNPNLSMIPLLFQPFSITSLGVVSGNAILQGAEKLVFDQ